MEIKNKQTLGDLVYDQFKQAVEQKNKRMGGNYMDYTNKENRKNGGTKWVVVDARDVGWTYTKKALSGKEYKVTGIYLDVKHTSYIEVFTSSILPTKKNHLKFNVALKTDYDYPILKYDFEESKLKNIGVFKASRDEAETLFSFEDKA